MKLTATFFALSLALNALATPLGSPSVFRRHTGVPANNARRYILQSRMDAPPACAAKTSTISNSTDIPDLSNSTVTDSAVGNTDNTGNSTDTSTTSTTGNSTDTSTTDTTGNLSNTTTIDPAGNAPSDNSTVPDTSNSTDSSTARRRRGIFSTSSSVTTTTTTAITLDVVDLAFEWQSLCLVSGVDIFLDNSPCIQLAGVHGFDALLADADPCAQQTFADSIITFAKSPGIVNKADLIAFALKYRRHPRAAVNILGVLPSSLYCMQAPINPELTGIINAQPDGVNPGLFGSPNDPVVPFGSEGTCPLSTTADVSTCSCVPDSTSGTDASVLDDGSSTNSTVIDPLATASVNGPTPTGASPSASANDPSITDSSAVTDTATSTDGPTTTDSAVSDAAAPTDSASTDSSVTDSGSTPTDSSATPAATDSSSDISGDVNDPNGRRK